MILLVKYTKLLYFHDTARSKERAPVRVPTHTHYQLFQIPRHFGTSRLKRKLANLIYLHAKFEVLILEERKLLPLTRKIPSL